MNILKSLGKVAYEAAKSEISDRARKVHLASEAVPITQDNVYSLKVGDFVRNTSAKQFYMVVRPKTKSDEGVLAVLKIPFLEWYYMLKYCPYSKTVSEDGGCRIQTAAYNRTDGRLNTISIMNQLMKLEAEEHNPWRCPPPIHKFPAFEFIKRYGDDTYIPAIEELYDIIQNEDLRCRLFSLARKCNIDTFSENENVYIWSSTDNKNKNLFGEEALSILVDRTTSTIIQSMRKSKKAYVIPLKRF